MSDAGAREQDGLRVMLLIAYGLFVLALFNGVTAIAGVILVYLKRGEARGTPWESHCRNLIHVFWIGTAVIAIITALALQLFGGMLYALVTNHDPAPALAGLVFLAVPVVGLAAVILTVWYLYRTLRGLIRASESLPY